MKYSPIHKSLIIQQKDLQGVSDSMLFAMRRYRIITNTPLGKRENDGPLSEVDHAEKGIIDGLKSIGIDLGVSWGWELVYNEKVIASKEGREGIQINICEHKFNMLFEGKEYLDKQVELIKSKIAKLKEKLNRLETIEIFGI